MKTLNECLDLILQTLVENDGSISVYIDKERTKVFSDLFLSVDLSMKEFMESLDILKEKGYLSYFDVQKIYTDNSENYEFLQNHALHPCIIFISVKGKFFRLQGGFQGEETTKNSEKNRIKKQDEQIRLLTLLLAIGSIGVLIIEALRFIIDYVL